MLNRTFFTLARRASFNPLAYSQNGRRLFHFDTHHFVQRLEREGLSRTQAEGIMGAIAEVIDESIRNMKSNMVTKADQEKACYTWTARRPLALTQLLEPLHTTGRLCAAQVGAAADGEERFVDDQSGERAACV
jgi:hypothetical protein